MGASEELRCIIDAWLERTGMDCWVWSFVAGMKNGDAYRLGKGSPPEVMAFMADAIRHISCTLIERDPT